MKKSPAEAMKMLERLSTGILGLRVWLEKKTRMGKKSHPSDELGFTRAYLDYYEIDHPESVLDVLNDQGITSDRSCLIWLLQHDDLIPDEE